MGNKSNKAIFQGEPTHEMIEAALLVRIFRFDLNGGVDPTLSVENRVQRENSNDLGEYPMNHTIHIVITEFKKFIYLNSLEILKRKREGTLDMKENYQKDGIWYYKAPFWAPPYIDRIWKNLILYNYIYEDFCKRAVGGFIDRTPPIQDWDQAYQEYTQCLEHLDQKKSILKPFNGLWPRYENVDQYKRDFEYFSFIGEKNINKIKTEMIEKIAKADPQTLDLSECMKLAKKAAKSVTLTCEYTQPDLEPITGFDCEDPWYKARDMDPAEAYAHVQSMKFPACFKEDLMRTNLVDSNTAEKWIFEYKLFLTMGYTAGKVITPSEETDQVWHLHQTYTRHYRKSMAKYLKKKFKHQPTLGGQAENEKWDECYNGTTHFYESLFGVHPPDEVWGSSQERFAPEKFMFRNVNLFRLAVMLTVSHLDKDFLVLENSILRPSVKNSDSVSEEYSKNCMEIRKNIREGYIAEDLKFGWRIHYNGSGYFDVWDWGHDDWEWLPENIKPVKEVKDYGYKGPHYLVAGGVLFTGWFM